MTILAPMIGCSGEVTADVERDQNADGTHTTKMKTGLDRKFLVPTSAPTPEYSVLFEEYPANRKLLSASATYPASLNGATPGQSLTAPANLVSGGHYKAVYQVGSWTQSYDVVLVAQTGLPAGTYLLDSPGMMEDVVIATRDYPNSPVQVTISGNLGSTLADLLPTKTFGVAAADMPDHLTLTVPASQTYLIGETVVSRPENRPPYNHSPVTKTTGE